MSSKEQVREHMNKVYEEYRFSKERAENLWKARHSSVRIKGSH